ncbi:hypothetical protein KSP39_PZI005300 [Platanthera zijinensis]|uniref:GBF-interacting protein 1 N-terminal domain-containing protein n=1 Tax=Platanthera zijinensis TaxID=2320716 RepID=A0AAP0GB11_9ASPA
MNGGGGGGVVGSTRGNGAVTAAGIPAGVKKIVQSLKEIVNLPDQEIYATLKECGMDPSEAVQRLLTQDSFHEVKSKREKKKETKEPPDSRSRTINSTSSRGVRGTSDRGPRTTSIQSSSNTGYGVNHGKAAQKKDDGAGSAPSSKFASSFPVDRRSTITSENASTENQWQATSTASGISINSQPSSGYQHTWPAMPGHFSMADIVKMGRPQGRLPATSTVAGHVSHNQFSSDTSDKYSVDPVQSSELDEGVHSSQILHQQTGDMDAEPRTIMNEHASDDDWSYVNQSNSGIISTILETSGSAVTYADSSAAALVTDEAQLHLHDDEAPELDQSPNSESVPESQSVSEGEIDVNLSEDKSEIDDDSLQNMNSYLSQRHLFEQQEVDDANEEISSAAANLQNLRLQKDDLAAPSLEDNPAVIIPRHLQVTNADCSHLSFGSFGSGIGTFSGSLQQKPLHQSSEATMVAGDVPSLDHSETRNSNYYDNDELKSQITEDTVSRGVMNNMKYDMSSASEPELSRDDTVSSSHEIQYNFPSLSGYGTSTSAQQSTAAFSPPQTNIQMQNHASLSALMQPYTSSLQSSLLAPTLQPLRDMDLPFSSLLANQPLSTKHSATTSVNGPAISMHEPKLSAYSTLQQVPQSSAGSNALSGHAIPQHLPINPYSQATLPLGPFTNVISYPFLPQSYTYLPSAAFPQAYTSNGPFHQSTSAVHNAGLKYSLPQYKSSLSVPSLQQPAAASSGYGNYGGSANIPGNFVLNPSTTSTSTTLGFDETLNSQKEGAHYLHLQQNESSPMWVHGGGSRTISSLPPNTFYGYQGQNQLNNFRQAQQPAHYGPMGYLNLYQNQVGGQSHEHQQNPGEANSQGNPSQPSHQIWQHGY